MTHSRPLAAPAGVLLVTRDVTEQAALEEELGLAKLAAEQGVRGFLTKPLDVKELLEVLDGIAAERKQAGHP